MNQENALTRCIRFYNQCILAKKNRSLPVRNLQVSDLSNLLQHKNIISYKTDGEAYQVMLFTTPAAQRGRKRKKPTKKSTKAKKKQPSNDSEARRSISENIPNSFVWEGRGRYKEKLEDVRGRAEPWTLPHRLTTALIKGLQHYKPLYCDPKKLSSKKPRSEAWLLSVERVKTGSGVNDRHVWVIQELLAYLYTIPKQSDLEYIVSVPPTDCLTKQVQLWCRLAKWDWCSHDGNIFSAPSNDLLCITQNHWWKIGISKPAHKLLSPKAHSITMPVIGHSSYEPSEAIIPVDGIIIKNAITPTTFNVFKLKLGHHNTVDLQINTRPLDYRLSVQRRNHSVILEMGTLTLSPLDYKDMELEYTIQHVRNKHLIIECSLSSNGTFKFVRWRNDKEHPNDPAVVVSTLMQNQVRECTMKRLEQQIMCCSQNICQQYLLMQTNNTNTPPWFGHEKQCPQDQEGWRWVTQYLCVGSRGWTHLSPEQLFSAPKGVCTLMQVGGWQKQGGTSLLTSASWKHIHIKHNNAYEFESFMSATQVVTITINGSTQPRDHCYMVTWNNQDARWILRHLGQKVSSRQSLTPGSFILRGRFISGNHLSGRLMDFLPPQNTQLRWCEFGLSEPRVRPLSILCGILRRTRKKNIFQLLVHWEEHTKGEETDMCVLQSIFIPSWLCNRTSESMYCTFIISRMIPQNSHWALSDWTILNTWDMNNTVVHTSTIGDVITHLVM